MNTILSFNRLMEGGTFYFDETPILTKWSATAVKDLEDEALDELVGKAVTVTSNETVGFGTAGSALVGIVTKAEFDSNAKSKIVVTVDWQGTFENVPTAAALAAGDEVEVNGNGSLQKAAAGGRAIVVSAGDNTATILML